MRFIQFAPGSTEVGAPNQACTIRGDFRHVSIRWAAERRIKPAWFRYIPGRGAAKHINVLGRVHPDGGRRYFVSRSAQISCPQHPCAIRADFRYDQIVTAAHTLLESSCKPGRRKGAMRG